MHTVIKATEDVNGTVVASDCDAIEYDAQLQSKSFVKMLSDMRSGVNCVLHAISVGKKNIVEAIGKTRLTKWTTTIQSQILETV